MSAICAKDGSVRPDEDFAMDWEVDPQSRSGSMPCQGADPRGSSISPPTPGREGGGHLLARPGRTQSQEGADGVDVKRVTFTHHQAVGARCRRHPRELDQPLIDAYMARRALDYLVGFTLSPCCGASAGQRSAGRVQSVGLRLICERGSRDRVFQDSRILDGRRDLRHRQEADPESSLTHLDGRKLDKFDLDTGERADQAKREIERRAFSVLSIRPPPGAAHPSAAFITSTLQQEASRKLGLGARTAMAHRPAALRGRRYRRRGRWDSLLICGRRGQLAPEEIGQTRA